MFHLFIISSYLVLSSFIVYLFICYLSIYLLFIYLSVIVAKNILLQRSHNCGVWNYWQQNSFTAYVILYELVDTWFLDSNRRVGVRSLPWRWHILSIPLTSSPANRRRNLWVVYIYIYIYIYIYRYMHFLYGFCYRTYIYIQQECHSVLVKLHPITSYVIVFLGSAQFLGWMPLFVFFGLPIVSCSLMIVV